MHILIGLLALIGGAVWWWIRRNPREAVDTAADLAVTLKNAPRKLAFHSKTNVHPVEGIDDPRIAICAIGQAFIELDDLPTKDQRNRLNLLLRTRLNCDADEAHEAEVIGRWLVSQCNGAKLAIPRLARRLRKIDGDASWTLLQDVLSELVSGELTPGQTDAIADLRSAFRK